MTLASGNRLIREWFSARAWSKHVFAIQAKWLGCCWKNIFFSIRLNGIHLAIQTRRLFSLFLFDSYVWWHSFCHSGAAVGLGKLAAIVFLHRCVWWHPSCHSGVTASLLPFSVASFHVAFEWHLLGASGFPFFWWISGKQPGAPVFCPDIQRADEDGQRGQLPPETGNYHQRRAITTRDGQLPSGQPKQHEGQPQA